MVTGSFSFSIFLDEVSRILHYCFLSGNVLSLNGFRYGADIARGVAELHAAGVVCMNLKPANLLLDATGHAVVSDYGLPAICLLYTSDAADE